MVYLSGKCGFWMINNRAEKKFLWSGLTWDTSGMSVCSTERVWISSPQSKFPPPHGDEAIPADPIRPPRVLTTTLSFGVSQCCLQAFVCFSLKAACALHCNPQALASEWRTDHVGYMQYSKLQAQDWLTDCCRQPLASARVSSESDTDRERVRARARMCVRAITSRLCASSTIWGTVSLSHPLFILLSAHYCFAFSRLPSLHISSSFFSYSCPAFSQYLCSL